MRYAKQVGVTLIVLGVLAAGIAVFLWSGSYNVAADVPHTRLMYSALTAVRERSVRSRAAGISVPNLDSPQMIAAGAGQYAEMCASCHLAPGATDSDIRLGLNPQPPNLARRGAHDAAAAFWVIKHGIKMSAMPAWGRTHDDQAIWNMVAFLQRLPQMSVAQYRQLTANDSAKEGESENGHVEKK